MGTKISIAVLSYLTWVGAAFAALNSTGPQTFTDQYEDNIALPQQYKEVIMYLTPTEIRTLQQTSEQHSIILQSPTAQPETPRDNDDRTNYFYPNNENSEQEQPRYASSSQGYNSKQEQPRYASSSQGYNSEQEQPRYASSSQGYNSEQEQPRYASSSQRYNSEQEQPRYASSSQGYNQYSENREALYNDQNKQRDSVTPVAESTYAYRDQNSYVYNRIKTMFMQNDKYIAPKLKNPNLQLKQYMNPQTPTTTTEKPKAKGQQESLSDEEWQAAYNFLQLDSAKESSDTNNKESSYYGAQNSLTKQTNPPSFEPSFYSQKNAFFNFQQGRLYPISNNQESRQTTEAPTRNQETLLIPSNLDRDAQLIFKNKYQLVPYYPEPKNKEEHTVLLQELLNQRIPDNVKASMFQNTQSQMPEKENDNSQNAPNYSSDGLLPEESQKILLRIMTHNMEAHAKAEALNKLRQNIQKNIKKNIPEETKKLIINMIMKNMEAKVAAMKSNEEILTEEAKIMLQTMMMKNLEAQANAETLSKMPLNQPNQGALPEDTKKILQNAILNNMESQAKVAAISKLPPIIIRKEVKITKQTPLQWFNGQPVSQAVWWPASTVPEMNVPRVYQVPQDIKPLGLATMVRSEKVDLDKQVVDLEKHFSAMEQKPAESASSFYSEPRGQDKSESEESLQKPKQLTIIKHVWSD